MSPDPRLPEGMPKGDVEHIVDDNNLDTRFLKGVALSVWQNSGDTNSNWSDFARRKNYFGQAEVAEAFHTSNDFWNNYENDIGLCKDLGCTAFRFSLEWARFEPEKGCFDDATVSRYHAILDCLAAHKLEPMVTLHHFTHPIWFEELGGFSNEENILYFVLYTKYVYSHFGSRIKLWATFNEPTCYALVGHIIGLWAPGQMLRFRLAGTILGNILRCHVAAYQAIKALQGGHAALVGIVHQHIRFVPKSDNMSKHYVRPICDWMTYWFGWDVLCTFFKTGKFQWKVPFSSTQIEFREPAAPDSLDWWGINYYSRPVIDWNFAQVGMTEKEEMTDMNLPIVPQDMYHSIQMASSLGVPMYITETGLADGKDRSRAQLIKAYYGEVLRAVHEGYDVRGIFYWTLMDNIEWHMGFRMKFGLYAWSPETGRASVRLRTGSHALIDLHAKMPNDLLELKAFAAAWKRNDANDEISTLAEKVVDRKAEHNFEAYLLDGTL